jgi:hypothetical protein
MIRFPDVVRDYEKTSENLKNIKTNIGKIIVNIGIFDPQAKSHDEAFYELNILFIEFCKSINENEELIINTINNPITSSRRLCKKKKLQETRI